jgi:6-phosphofructo-2-kinase/fructose-2,6-biphosphatase 2
MKHIYLSRHGESKYNLEKRIGGNSNLTINGERYSKLLTEYVNNMNIDTIYTSELKRTIETVKHITHPKRIMKELNEIKAGICENLTYNDVKTIYPYIYTERNKDKYNYRYPKGESYNDLLIRLKPVFDIINNTKKTIFIVAHQAILRIIYGELMNIAKTEQPYIAVPLHTIIHLSNTNGYINAELNKLM